MLLLELQTTQITALKISLEVIDSLLTDVNLEISTTGIRIREVNKLSKLFLSAYFSNDNFESFSLNKPFNCGIELSELVSVLKPTLHYDSLKIKILSEKSDEIPSVLVVILESFKRNELKSVRINLLPACPNNCGNILDKVYSHSIIIPTDIFIKYLKDCSRISDRVRLVLSKKHFMIESGDSNIQYNLNSSGSNNIGITTECSSTITSKAEVMVRYLLQTSKLNNISELTYVFLDQKETQPIFRYNLGSLGILNLCLL